MVAGVTLFSTNLALVHQSGLVNRVLPQNLTREDYRQLNNELDVLVIVLLL